MTNIKLIFFAFLCCPLYSQTAEKASYSKGIKDESATTDTSTLPAPSHLTTDLLEHTDRVFLDGYPSNISLTELGTAIERYQLAENPQYETIFGLGCQQQSAEYFANGLPHFARFLAESAGKGRSRFVGQRFDGKR
jgi:hypothetical protein